MTSIPLTKIEEHVTTVTEVTKTYDSAEMLKEAEEIMHHPQEIIDAASSTPKDLAAEVAAEIAKPDTNWVKVAIFVLLALIPTLGTFFGVWFSFPK